MSKSEDPQVASLKAYNGVVTNQRNSALDDVAVLTVQIAVLKAELKSLKESQAEE